MPKAGCWALVGLASRRSTASDPRPLAFPGTHAHIALRGKHYSTGLHSRIRLRIPDGHRPLQNLAQWPSPAISRSWRSVCLYTYFMARWMIFSSPSASSPARFTPARRVTFASSIRSAAFPGSNLLHALPDASKHRLRHHPLGRAVALEHEPRYRRCDDRRTCNRVFPHVRRRCPRALAAPRKTSRPATSSQKPLDESHPIRRAAPVHIVPPPRRASHLPRFSMAPSSRGLGHGPFKAATRVRIPSGSSLLKSTHWHEKARIPGLFVLGCVARTPPGSNPYREMFK